MRRKPLKRAAAVALLLLFAVWAYRGIRGDSRFNADKLIGLTPEQAIARLGPPDYDPRTLTPGWTPADEASGDPLKIFYDDRWSWLGNEYMIVFQGGRVVDVKTARK